MLEHSFFINGDELQKANNMRIGSDEIAVGAMRWVISPSYVQMPRRLPQKREQKGFGVRCGRGSTGDVTQPLFGLSTQRRQPGRWYF